MKRVGAEISAADRWHEIGKTYADKISQAYYRQRLAATCALLPDLTDKRVLDFGCGEGVLLREARRRRAKWVAGTDLNAEMIERARTTSHADVF